MKTILITLSSILLLTSSCSTMNTTWLAYCNKYQVNPQSPTEEQYNYYLDCYLGSYEQENDTK